MSYRVTLYLGHVKHGVGGGGVEEGGGEGGFLLLVRARKYFLAGSKMIDFHVSRNTENALFHQRV